EEPRQSRAHPAVGSALHRRRRRLRPGSYHARNSLRGRARLIRRAPFGSGINSRQGRSSRPAKIRARARARLKTRVELIQGTVGERPRMRATTAEITNRMIATKKMIFAISTAKPAIPQKRSTAAISAMIRNVKAQPSMAVLRHVKTRAACSSSAHYAFHKRRARGNVPRVSFLATVRPASRKPAPLAASAVTRAAHLDDLRMHVLGEPVGRQLMAEAALLRLAVDEGAGGGELIAEADIVDEASDVS